MSKLFDSDGICGVVNKEFTCELAFRAGQVIAKVFAKDDNRKVKIYIGKDTRISSGMIECAFAAGASSAGADVGLLGCISTPAVAYITHKHGADAGVVITTSHNTAEYNGIKIFNSKGVAITAELQEKIKKFIFSQDKTETVCGTDVGAVEYVETARKEYSEHIKNTVIGDLSGIKLLIDCANGAVCSTVHTIFENLNAEFDVIGIAPNGVNINENCGTAYIDKLRSKVASGGYDLGIAFDGEGVRCIAVDENGAVIDGNKIMALCATSMAQCGKLCGNAFVATGHCNLGLYSYAEECGIQIESSEAGEKNILSVMENSGYVLGGDQAGHIIFREYSVTADGQLAAVQFASVIKEVGEKASDVSGKISNYPQMMINVKVPNEVKDEVLNEWTVKETIHRIEEQLGSSGRISVWASSNEPMIKVLVESVDSKLASELSRVAADQISMISKMKKASKK